MPLSKDFDRTRSLTARRSFAVWVHVGGDVAGADAQRGLSGRVGGLDHGVAAGGEDQGDAGVPHQQTGRLDGRLLDPLHAVFRRARGDRGVPHDAGGLGAAALGGGVEGEHHRVAGLQGHQRLEERGGGRIGDRGDRGHHAHRLGDLDHVLDVVTAYDPDGLHAAHAVRDVLAREHVLGRLVLEDTASRLVDREAGQGGVLVEGGDRGLLDDVVDLLLGQGLVVRERLQTGRDQTVHGDRGVRRDLAHGRGPGPRVVSGHGGLPPLSGTAVRLRRRRAGASPVP
ncbi:hypothetical protein RKD25_000439 [Streptomyces sp. SAI-124]